MQNRDTQILQSATEILLITYRKKGKEVNNHAESMQGLKRTHRCGELSAANVGETVTIMGWVQKNRNKGGLVFTDVRDRSGIIQVVCEEGTTDAAIIEKAASLRAEYVVAVVGKVERRSGAVNDKIATGEIEVIPSELRVLLSHRHLRSQLKKTQRQRKTSV